MRSKSPPPTREPSHRLSRLSNPCYWLSLVCCPQFFQLSICVHPRLKSPPSFLGSLVVKSSPFAPSLSLQWLDSLLFSFHLWPHPPHSGMALQSPTRNKKPETSPNFSFLRVSAPLSR